jgi:peptidoglycan hydrolase-like protein with peptidoglycan-binding domain
VPLRSRLFAENTQLQACLVSDTAHVVSGARGDHVALIQSALVRLRALDPTDAAKEARFYGPKTAAAVLAYKRAFGIINRSYQKEADNIVGKMTIASLDQAILVLDGTPGPPRGVAFPGPHPQSPPATPQSAALPVTTTTTSPATRARPQTVATVRGVEAGVPELVNTGMDPFAPPLSDLPLDVQATVRRTNDAKKPDLFLLFPFLAKHEGPLSAADLSARFAANPSATQILRDLHVRMNPFDIWKNIRIIVNVYTGVGSRGLFCEPFNHDAFLAQMQALTTGPRIGPDPNVVPLQVPLTDSKFCRDGFNVHGPRDSFREIVKQGPGLHICITQPAARATEPCDLHIDQVQQGQVCSNGVCIPIINGQTIEHLRTVAPWLAEEAKKKFRKLLPN